MSKVAVAGLLLALSAMMLAGCGGGNQQKVFHVVLERAVYNDLGTRIAFTALGGNRLDYVYSISDAASSLVLLTQTDNDTDLTDEGGKQPAWSPDGTKFAIVASRGTGGQALYLIDPVGGSNVSEVVVTNPAVVGADAEPNWIDNSSLIYVSTKGGSGWDIYTINSNGTANTLVVPTAEDKQWPDIRGTKIVYQRRIGAQGVDTAICVWDTAAPGETVLGGTGANGFRDEHPSFNPTGTKIAFTSNRNGSFDIWTMNADGTVPTQLTFGQPSDGYPVYSRDGLRIVFIRDQEVWTMLAADGSDLKQITQVFQPS